MRALARDDLNIAVQTGLAIQVAANVPNNLAGLAPSLITIRRVAGSPDSKDDMRALRQAEFIGTAVSLASAIGASLLVKSTMPIWWTGAMLVIYLTTYEHAARHPHESGTDIGSDNQFLPGY